ncbi:GTP pyrophosphokinase family protein [Clostridium cochlearium]|uniref:GTP pyrophosphokinase n=1 Tax=Clostridium cochlearium TaxID=1494 RepID=UPI001EDD6777|nr:relA/spoT family protein [Clostridium cochlearium]MCG4571457.1 relA/spoT family protein [Clostridium cochlearium]MCG4580347.1 relA/spoT family protein [Clostridium cochlearium]
MELRMFQFIDKSIEHLEDLQEDLEKVCKEIEIYFEESLEGEDGGFLNVNSRVKSSKSLKEKIIRNNYYKKYKSPEELFKNLSDLIGIRIECRFIEDENNIYEKIKNNFNKKDENGYYYNEINENIKLDLTGEQPQQQRNGFEIFRIDGFYQYDDKRFNFELQIKSLVNIFWGEIEHKVIYKNNNYMLVDDFFKNIMGSIKKNLSMIDNQLLLIYKQVNQLNTIDPTIRKAQLEMMMAKIIYDIFSTKMRNHIGLIVDFRRSCDVIMKYIFRTNNAENLEEYNQTLLKTLSRLNEIGKNEMNFTEKIKFERQICIEDEFCGIIGDVMLNSINKDFQWNIFFKMLFEIELGNNAEDFEDFIAYFKGRFYNNKSFTKLHFLFEESEVESIVNSMMKELANCFVEIDSISFVYEENIESINKIIDNIIKIVVANVNTFEEWENTKDIYLEFFKFKVFSVFDYKVGVENVKEFIERVKNHSGKIHVSEGILKYIDKLELLSEITAKDALHLIKLSNINENALIK